MLLDLQISRQPTETTCGPTCLHAVYRYHGDDVDLATVISEVHALEEGGTLGVLLGLHALRRGYRATLYSYNVEVFDPTWFELDQRRLSDKLRAQAAEKRNPRLGLATEGYLEFLEEGGKLLFEDLTTDLLKRHLEQGTPILTGLSATWLYRAIREIPATNKDDDIRGLPAGHFVLLTGWHDEGERVVIADPFDPNPFSDGHTHSYEVSVPRLATAILLGILTYDANLLVVEPWERRQD